MRSSEFCGDPGGDDLQQGGGVDRLARDPRPRHQLSSTFRPSLTSTTPTVALLHLYAGRHPDGPRLTEPIGEPPLMSDAFRGLWGDHDAQAHTAYRLGRSYWDWLMIQSRMPGIV
ncbi:hypothetical protein [Streptomyces avermitilis]|uniref:MmyB family transcriptional regulator n=1 Tax=Streptomyces avermitilis TaxID=33903 RepID=UPI0038173B99